MTDGPTCSSPTATCTRSWRSTISEKNSNSPASCSGIAATAQFFDMSSTGGPGITAKHASRGIAVGDLDNDGSQEIVVVNLFEPPSLLKNFGPRGNALLVRAVTASGRDAIGARLTLTVGGRKEIDEVRSGGYHISQGDFRVHFGMGHATKADLTIRWPDGPVGNVETIPGVDANQWIVVREDRGIVERHPFTHDTP